MKFSPLLMILTLFLFFDVKGADGCYVGGVLYTQHSRSGAYFYRSPGNITANCGVSGTISGSCRLYNGGNVNNNSSYTRYTNSYSTSISVIPCPIDNKAWVLIIMVSIFSIFKLRFGVKT